jgi:hypothetical protein
LAARDDVTSGPFYHGTKADLKPGDLITPGYRSNYSHGERTSPWVYLSATLSPWGAELAKGDGPGRLYIVEPTGPFVDDPDLTDKRFPGNPTKSYRSRDPLRVVGEVTDWEPHSPQEIQAMMDGQARMYAMQAARVARIPSKADFDQIHAQADELAREWTPEPEYFGCTLLMLIRGAATDVFSALSYRSEAQDETRIIELPCPIDVRPGWPQRDVPLSGRITHVSAWHEGWVAVIESCDRDRAEPGDTALDRGRRERRHSEVPVGRRRARAVVAAEPATGAWRAHRYRTRRDLGLQDGPLRWVRSSVDGTRYPDAHRASAIR